MASHDQKKLGWHIFKYKTYFSYAFVGNKICDVFNDGKRSNRSFIKLKVDNKRMQKELN